MNLFFLNFIYMFLNFSFCHKTEKCNPKIDLTNLTRWALSQYLKTKLEYDWFWQSWNDDDDDDDRFYIGPSTILHSRAHSLRFFVTCDCKWVTVALFLFFIFL